jgi:hypothetical protein
MRINIYNEELTDRVEKIEKVVDGIPYYGIRLYLYMPVTNVLGSNIGREVRGPFIHRDGDDDSSAITFWSTSKQALRNALGAMMVELDTSQKDKPSEGT